MRICVLEEMVIKTKKVVKIRFLIYNVSIIEFYKKFLIRWERGK